MQIKIILSCHCSIIVNVVNVVLYTLMLLIFFSSYFSLSYFVYSMRMKEKIKIPKVVMLTV